MVLLALLAACESPSGPTRQARINYEGGLDSRGETAFSRGGDIREGPLKSIYFEFASHSLLSDARATLEHNAQLLRENRDWQIRIEGNCDERGSDEYNLALGNKRAEVAKNYLVDLGIDGRRMETISYGEEAPVATGWSEDSWAKNRRDDFVLR